MDLAGRREADEASTAQRARAAQRLRDVKRMVGRWVLSRRELCWV